MRIYFVRHGQSIANANNIRQKDDTPLTDLGLRQAQFVAKRLAKIPVDLIIASPHTRARQTAETISKELKKDIIYSDLFVERKKPLAVMGLSVGDPRGDEIMNEVYKNFYVPGWHLDESENFEDSKKRAMDATQFLKNQTAEHIVVVTHGLFLRNLLGVLIFGGNLTPQENESLHCFRIQNTGVSVCTYRTKEEAGSEYESGWHIETWNDQAHLG